MKKTLSVLMALILTVSLFAGMGVQAAAVSDGNDALTVLAV